jgi:Flp pilus assembly protein TadB
MNTSVFNLFLLISGMWIVLISYYIDFDFLRIELLLGYFRNIKEKTLITVPVAFIGIVVAIITKVFVFVPESLVIEILLPGMLVNQREIKIQDQKMSQWTLLIDDLVSGVRAGSTISEALSQALQNCEEPLRSDFQ